MLQHVADLEQHSRMNDITLNGLDTKLWSYAAADGEMSKLELNSLEQA